MLLWEGRQYSAQTASVLPPQDKPVRYPFIHLGREKQVRVKCLAQGHNTRAPTGFELITLGSWVRSSTAECLIITLHLAYSQLIIVGIFIPVSSLKVFGHSIHSEKRRIYLGKSIQALQNDTIIISWVFSFRVIQPTVRWHTFKTFMFVFINSCSS